MPLNLSAFLMSVRPPLPPRRTSRGPPPIPPRPSRPPDVDLARALARRPPPPPVKPQRVAPIACLECRDFTEPDAHAALFPRQSVASLDHLAHDLTARFASDTDKARAIFTWLHHNIAYDAPSFFSGNIRPATADSTLSSGLAVCDGYAGLFVALAARAGIEARKISGHGKGVGFLPPDPGAPVPPYSSGHAWNCALLDGTWRLIDPCWGAGALHGTTYQPGFAPRWFTSSPIDFVRTHYPEDPAYQLLSSDEGGPVSWEDYIMEPAGPTIFLDFYALSLWPAALQPPTRDIHAHTHVSFQLFKRCEHMSMAEADNFVFIISLGKERIPLAPNDAGGWSADAYIPSGVQEVSLYSVTTVDGRDAKGFGLQAFKSALGRKAMTFGGLARWNVI
ncbi:hypothetical protein H0H81_008570 [Sphagnurus paluster]|uniref:Transglutaminase-like domain-containing protein n=1 Tax=Sphagnurus paluster TaxID=117069 RepID=A0A9P7GT07_9AGAR|nr:hypothetical protein H0H81_008570 [Sphagnurus paluster]